MIMKTTYLDYAAATPLDKRVLRSMEPYFAGQFYNPSALYLPAKKVAKDIAEARGKIAKRLGIKSTEAVFTAGGTEANNLAVHGVMSRQNQTANIVVSAIEHPSVLLPAEKYNLRLCPVDSNGIVDLSRLEKLIDDNTALVSIIYANNEVGTVQPLRQISNLIKDKRRQRPGELPLYFHTDAAQAANYLSLNVSGLGVDMMSINGGKIYGPKASGLLFVKTGVGLSPIIQGGGQEQAIRSGTENVPAIIGLSTALDIAQDQYKDQFAAQQKLQNLFIKTLNQKLPQAIINGSTKHRLPNNIHVSIPNNDNERLIMQLDGMGILCAAGSACSASKDEPSHVLRAMGISDQQSRSSLRFSLGRPTTAADIRRTVDCLCRIIV